MEKNNLTISEVLTLKRQHGIPASYYTERAGIISGQFPYGQCIQQAGKRCVFRISSAKALAWIKDFIGETTEGGEPDVRQHA